MYDASMSGSNFQLLDVPHHIFCSSYLTIYLSFLTLTLLGRAKSNGFDGKFSSTSSSSVNESTPITAKEARLKKILEEELVDPDKLMNKNKKQARSMYDSNAKIISKKGRSSYNTLDLRTTENLGESIYRGHF